MPKKLVVAGITHLQKANRHLREVYLPAFNAGFSLPAAEPGSPFVPFAGEELVDILCEQYERTVDKGSRAQFEGLKLQIPPTVIECTT